MTKFSDLKLDPKVLQAISEAGYETPTPIQAGAIPPALEGRDVLGIAQTGTGKTASFTLPMITMLGRGRARARMPRSLVLCPTRELAAQVAENFDTYAKHTKLTKALLIGGVSFAEQDKLIDRGVDVLIATPGRLLDHHERGKLLLTGVQIMVVDEADRMLDMGFIPDIERIFQLTPFTRQTLFFSATMAPEIERITNTFLHAPERIEVARQATASETISQKLVEIAPGRRDQIAKQKRELLRALIDAEGTGLKNAIVFCNRKTDVDIVAKSLAKHGYDAAPIHGDLDQSHRTRTLDSFRDGRLKLLIASDVAARGLDIPAVSHVFNFDLPSHAEDYVHRIGRTGRAGRTGTAISIGTPADDKYLSAIENLVKQSLPRASIPDGFSLTETGDSPSRRDRDDRKSGSDRRRRGRGDDERGQGGRKPADTRGEARTETRPQTTAAEPAREHRQDGRRGEAQSRRGEPRDDRRRGRGRGDDHRGPAVVGMGDHVPQFMLVALRSSSESSADLDEAPTPAEAPSAEARTDEAPARRKTRSRRKAAPPAEAEPKAVAEEVTEVAATAANEGNAGAAESAPEPKAETQEDPAPAKPKRSRRKKADTATTQPEEAAEDAAPKARKPRSRKAKTETEVEADADAETATAEPEAASKPARSRRKKTDAAAGEKAEAKPARRSRSKSAQPAEPAGDAAAASEPQSQNETADSADAEA